VAAEHGAGGVGVDAGLVVEEVGVDGEGNGDRAVRHELDLHVLLAVGAEGRLEEHLVLVVGGGDLGLSTKQQQ